MVRWTSLRKCRVACAVDDCSGVETAPRVGMAGSGRSRWNVSGSFGLGGGLQRGHGCVVVTVHICFTNDILGFDERLGGRKVRFKRRVLVVVVVPGSNV